MASAKDIRFDQRNVTNTAYQEKYVNGNSLIIRTDSTGSVVGASTLEGVAIGTTTPSTANFTNVTASVISSSILIGNLSGSLSGSNIIANNISSSTLYVSQNIINDGTLTVVGNSTLSNVTASNISASGNISSSNLFVSNNTTLGNDVNDLIKITGSLSLSGSTSTNSSSFVDLTANRVVYTDNNRILSTDDDLIFDGNALTASNLLANTVDINGGTIDGTTIGLTSATTAKFTEITASNISASGNISSSTADFNTLTSISSTLFNVTSSNISASGYISASTVDTTNLISVNNILTNITSSNISASGNTELNTLSVKGSTVLYGDLTVYGSSSVVNISSSTVIIGDNRIQLNAWSTGSLSQRYAGLDLTDSGSNNAVTSSLLWDSANNYWLLTNNQTGSNPVVTSSALILQGPVSNFGNEKQVPINTFLKVETTVGNLTASNLSETGNTLTYDGTVSSSAISASSAFFSLDVLISGVLKVVNKIYAYAGIIGDITGSLSGSNIIVNTITSSVITASNIISTNNDLFVVTSSVISSSTLISNNNTLVNVTSSNISASGYVSASFANFNTLTSVNNIFTDVTSSNISSSTLISNNNILVNVTSSNISASGYISGSNIYVENTITADTGSFIYFNINNTGSAPTNYTSSGMPGEVRFDNNFIYIYANNLWVRTPIVRWSD
jgi:hypothetical protein